MMTLGSSGIATYPSGSGFGPRRLRDWEFVWLVAGDARWEVDGAMVDAPQGTVVLARPGIRDRFRWDPRRTTRHGFIHFSLARIPAGLPATAGWPLARHAPEGPLVPVLDHCAGLIARRPPGWEDQAVAGIVFALRIFVGGESAPLATPAPPDHPVIERLLAHLRERWSGGRMPPVDLDDLCRATGVSRVHLTRICQRELGRPPAGVVRCLRLHAVAELLAGGRDPVQVVAARCGFASAFHLSRIFRAAYGCSPSVYRRRMQAGEAAPVPPLVRVAR